MYISIMHDIENWNKKPERAVQIWLKPDQPEKQILFLLVT